MSADHTQNLHSQFNITFRDTLLSKRLFYITGKGGVGRSSFALALTKYFLSRGEDAQFCSFEEPAKKVISSQFLFSREQAHQDYIAQKLSSKTISSWISSSSFFRSITGVVPGLDYLATTGYIMNYLNDNPGSKIILDAPASGHSLSALSASDNFFNVFKKGSMARDLKKMKSFYQEQSLCLVLSLPSPFALSETQEFIKQYEKISSAPHYTVLNQSLNFLAGQELPESLQRKVKYEKEHAPKIQASLSLPYLSSPQSEIPDHLANYLGENL